MTARSSRTPTPAFKRRNISRERNHCLRMVLQFIGAKCHYMKTIKEDVGVLDLLQRLVVGTMKLKFGAIISMEDSFPPFSRSSSMVYSKIKEPLMKDGVWVYWQAVPVLHHQKEDDDDDTTTMWLLKFHMEDY
ncbi:hypothetical protein REPUB_Repub02eG0013600 [Reevesia pubescens]